MLVLPNRRAGLFFARQLGGLIQQPHWMPRIQTIEEVFYGFSDKKPADQLTLIFELYKVYSSLVNQPESLDRFYYWGEMILKDFNDLDNFMVEADRLYHQLEEVKALESDLSYLTEGQVLLIREFWKSFEVKDKTQQEKFLKFWKLLRPMYKKFKEALSASGLAYSGMIYRQVVEELNQLAQPGKQYVFIGFNAFSVAEERLIKHFIKEFEAGIFWDVDGYYLMDPQQEAGMFFRQYRKDKIFGPTFPKEIKERIRQDGAKVQVHAIPLKVNQANLVGQLMAEAGAAEAMEETVVILPDEQLLFPVLHALPASIDQVNVTMGYPVKNSPAYGFLESLLELQKYVSLKADKVVFYHKPVRELLASSYCRSLNPDFVTATLKQIEESNQIYITSESLAAGGRSFQEIFARVQGNKLFPYLMTVIKTLSGELPLPELQQSYLYQCYKQLTRLDELFQRNEGIAVGLDFYLKLFRQVFREVRLPFQGEPLQGLQVMGVLESRNLDFRRVIICNMNEGSFPPAAAMNSMVPFNLRRAFGLPVQEQNDAIYAYTFYRLLHSAEEVHLIYTTASDDGKAGEKSRYIPQLVLESGLPVHERTVHIPVDLQPALEITIPKSQKILEILSKYEIKGENEKQQRLSPSAVNVWLDCRLKFYFRYVAGIKERDEVQEKIDPAVFGNLAHYSLEFLYQGFKSRKGTSILEKDDFAELKKNWIGPAVDLAIKKHYALKDIEVVQLSGQLIIARDVLQRYIRRLLEVDESDAPIEIISLEGSRNYTADMAINLPEGGKTIGLKGIIDRVDRVGETIRLIDYKSGADKKDFHDIPSLFDRDNKSRNKAAMQTMMYGLLYQESNRGEAPSPLKPAVYNLKDIFKDDFSPYLMMGARSPRQEILSYQEFEGEFLPALEACLTEIFHPAVPFDQTQEEEICERCPFREICSTR